GVGVAGGECRVEGGQVEGQGVRLVGHNVLGDRLSGLGPCGKRVFGYACVVERAVRCFGGGFAGGRRLGVGRLEQVLLEQVLPQGGLRLEGGLRLGLGREVLLEQVLLEDVVLLQHVGLEGGVGGLGGGALHAGLERRQVERHLGPVA